MSDGQASAQRPSEMGDLPENLGYSPFSETEVQCDACGMNIVRDREQMAKHHEFHAAAPASEADSSPRPPIP